MIDGDVVAVVPAVVVTSAVGIVSNGAAEVISTVTEGVAPGTVVACNSERE